MSNPPGLIVCIPTTGGISSVTAACLHDNLDDFQSVLTIAEAEPYTNACNRAANNALDAWSSDLELRYVLWISSNVWWQYGLVSRAVDVLEANSKVDTLVALASLPKAYADPLAITWDRAETGGARDHWRTYAPLQYQPGKLVPLKTAGMPWVVMRREALERVGEDPFTPLSMREVFPNDPAVPDQLATGDFSFLHRLNCAGGIAVTERAFEVGVVQDGRVYRPCLPAGTANGSGMPSS